MKAFRIPRIILPKQFANATFAGVCALMASSVANGASLIAHYKFDETSGTTAFNEVAANGGNGTIGSNVITGVPGIDGNAFRFQRDATLDGIVSMGNATDIFDKITPSGQLTISYWMKVESTATLGNRNVAVFLGDNSVNDRYIDSGISGAAPNIGTAQGRNRASGTIGELFGAVMNDGEFHHIALTINTATDTGALYVDGVLSAGPETNVGWDTFPILNNFEVGRLGRSSPVDSFGGDIDDLQIYNMALTANEVDSLFNNPGVAVPEPSSLTLGGLAFLGLTLRRRRRA